MISNSIPETTGYRDVETDAHRDYHADSEIDSLVITKETGTILVVEDEQILRDLLSNSLVSAGYEVVTANNGQLALETLATTEIDLILLDVMMPVMDGFTVCEEVRKTSDIPIVLLTALNRPDDVERGLLLGADEYITKPFTFREMKVRIQALLRRVSWSNGISTLSVITGEGIVLDDELEMATIRDKEVPLTPIEYRFLRYLMLRPDQPVDKDTLLREVWEHEGKGSGSIIQSVVRRLRLKIEDDPSDPRIVISVWGIGYKFQAHAMAET